MVQLVVVYAVAASIRSTGIGHCHLLIGSPLTLAFVTTQF